MKKIFLCALLFAGTMSSCVKNDVLDQAPAENDDLNIVGLDVAITATRGVETTADVIRNSADTYANSSNYTALILSFYATHFDSAYSATDTAAATANAETGTISFTYSSEDSAWSQSGNANTESASINELTWGHMSIGDTDADGNTPTAYFFSLHNGSETVTLGTPATSDEMATLTSTATADFTQNSWYKSSTSGGYDTNTIAASDQVDLVYYAGEVSAFPSGGNIRGIFHHALSRIEMYSSQGEYTPYVKSVSLVNVLKSGRPTITYTTATNSPSVTWANGTDKVGYICYNGIDASTGKQTTGEDMADGALLTSISDYASATSNNIMVIPQTLTPNLTTNTSDAIFNIGNNSNSTFGNTAYMSITAPYVAMIYRMLDSDGASVVGYKYACDCPEFSEAYNSSDNTTSTNILKVYNLETDAEYNNLATLNTTDGITVSGGSAITGSSYTEQELYNLMLDADSNTATADLSLLANEVTYNMGITPVSHLYMLVGFPVTTSTTLASGKDYDFKLGIGTTGGVLLHPYYVDAFGRSTRIEIDGIEVGEYVLATAETAIGLTITVNSWDDSVSSVDM